MMLTVNGKQVFAATGGVEPDDGRRPAMVLLHGAGMDSSVWQLQTRYLAHRARAAGLGAVLALDLPGHGRSEGPALESIPAMSNWLADVLGRFDGAGNGGDGTVDGDGSGHRAPVIVGHSMGTYIGLDLAANHPEAVRRLVLVATSATMPVHPDLMDASEADLPRAAALMTGWGHARPNLVGPHPAPGMAMAAGAQALIERSRPDALASSLRACAAFEEATDIAAAVGCPVIIVVGSADKMTPARAAGPIHQALVDGGTDVELITLPVGHMLMTEAAADLRQILSSALTADDQTG